MSTGVRRYAKASLLPVAWVNENEVRDVAGRTFRLYIKLVADHLQQVYNTK
jgi:hypothetical protein